MRHPPPTDKDAVTMGLIMDTLPDISQSCVQMAITWHLGRAQPDAVGQSTVLAVTSVLLHHLWLYKVHYNPGVLNSGFQGPLSCRVWLQP